MVGLVTLGFMGGTAGATSWEPGYCHTNTCYLYVGPWQWVEVGPEGFGWDGPLGAIGVIDMRSYPQSSQQGGTGGYGFWVSKVQLDPTKYRLLGTDMDGAVAPIVTTAAMNYLGVSDVSATTIRGLLWELLTQKGDPTGQARWYGLLPQPDGTFTLNVGGFSPVTFREDVSIGEQCKVEKAGCRGQWQETIRALHEAEKKEYQEAYGDRENALLLQ